MSEPQVIVEKSEGFAVLTLNRPDARNALSREMRLLLVDAIRRFDEDPEVRVVILAGRGKAFSAGLDLKELSQEPEVVSEMPRQENVVEAMAACSLPLIGAIQGAAITGGFEIALACDVLIASEDARFADTHARVGVLPGWGIGQKLSRVVGIYRAKELSLTGNWIDAATAERWGLVSRVVPADELLPACEKITHDMLACDPATLSAYKRLIDQGYATTLTDALETGIPIALEHARGLTSESVEGRRKTELVRGRQQSH